MLRARLIVRILVILSSILGALGLAGMLTAQSVNQANLSKVLNSSSLLINEVDATTPGADIAEFVELYDGGQGQTPLDGLVLVFFNGQDDRSYAAFDLGGYQSDAGGYFLLGNQSMPGVDLIFADTLLQGGPDAVALYQGTTADFPIGTAVTTNNLLDAIVYDTGDENDAGLLLLLHPGEPQVNEDSHTLADYHSNQRCPNGGGEPRRTANYLQELPTPKAANTCPADDVAPLVSSTSPTNGAVDIALDSEIVVTFSEAVEVGDGWFAINCTNSGEHATVVSGGDTVYHLDPQPNFAHGDDCTVTILGSQISDKDTNDPPDTMGGDYQWGFSILPAPIASHIIINEVDADTPGSDTAEFIELSDGGDGGTNLDGLIVVLFNGNDDRSYTAIDLDGQQTTEAGYFVIGNAAVAGADLIIADSTLQNGADAVAVYAGSAADFPNGTLVTSDNLLDALVYDTADADDNELLALLLAGEPQVDESGRNNPMGDSNQRCPDNSGGQRRSSAYLQNLPTPGTVNKCTYDAPPQVSNVTPQNGATHVAVDAEITINFSEPVTVTDGWFEIICAIGGQRSAVESGSSATYVLTADEVFAPDDLCTVTIFSSNISDADGDDPPDGLEADFQWTFSTASIPVAGQVIINEVDSDTPGSDTAEFIELSAVGTGETALDGLVVVLYNGVDNRSYAAFDLDGQQTTANGYFVIGNAAAAGVDLIIPDSTLQNGADAIALYAGSAVDYPNGTMVTNDNLLDALVYGTADADDNELLALLLAGESQVDESSRGNSMGDSNQRCPDSSGGQRRTNAYLQNLPTPGISNNCTFDAAPTVNGVTPQEGASNVATDSKIIITFSEPVLLTKGWFEIACAIGGLRSASVSGSGTTYILTPDEALIHGDSCAVTIVASKVNDEDEDDPPDGLTTDFHWSFTTITAVAADHVLINEVDADTSGSDVAEFIELYDGGQGNTALEGLVIVLYNGSNDLSYHSFDLDGWSTDSAGYFVLGNEVVPGIDLVFGNGSLQNGPDAVALFAGDGLDFANGTAVTTNNLLDALVYDTADADDEGLLILLHEGQPQVDEAGAGDRENHANQRCPNGEGGQRMSDGYVQNPPTPGAANDCTVDLPPEVAATQPPNGAAGIAPDAHIKISFSEAVTVEGPWFLLECESSGQHAVSISGGPIDYELDPAVDFASTERCTATVRAGQVSDLDGLPNTLSADYSWSFNIGTPQFGACGEAATPIHLIQGDGLSSPLSGTQAIVIEGIVSADFQGQDRLEGFFIQQNAGAADSDSKTSEGIFVHDHNPGIDVSVSEIVRLEGDVSEIEGMTSISQVTDLVRCGMAPSLSPTAVTLPLAETTDWESVEGMLVQIPQTMAVTGSDNLGSAGSVDLALNGRLFYPTEIAAPGAEALAAADLNRRSRITLDDGSWQSNPYPLPPYLGISTTLRVGDSINNLTGVLAENSFGYHIQPTQVISFTRKEQRPSVPPGPGDQLRLVSFDAGDYFNGDGQGGGFPGQYGAKSAAEFSRQRAKIISAIWAVQADVIALSGIENDGYGEYSALQDLVDGLNEALDGTPYALIYPGRPHLGETASAVALIYRRKRVIPIGAAVTTSTAPFDAPNSQPLVQTFAAAGSGETFVLAAVQFPGREVCPPVEDSNRDQGDGQGCYAVLRAQAAAALAAWLETDPSASDDDDILILGNLNAYTREDPLLELQGAGYANLSALAAPGSGYTVVKNGTTGTLNHALAAPSMAAQVQRLIQWHINAAEPQALDYRESNQAGLYKPDAYRSAAQDPLIVDLELAPVTPMRLFLPVTLFIE